MKTKYFMVLVLLFGVVGLASAQITGTVLDDEQAPLPGASVVVKGTTGVPRPILTVIFRSMPRLAIRWWSPTSVSKLRKPLQKQGR